MLKMKNVSKCYPHRGQTVRALDDATVHIEKGDFVSVVGPSGSGKSTLLLMLGGMLSPSSGKILLNDESIYDLSPDGRAHLRKHHIGYVFQTFNLTPYLTAIENVQIPLYLSKIPQNEQRERAAFLLEQVGLADRLDHKPTELSVGQQQRVALARMLANNPSLILADEPTGNLDSHSGAEIMGIFEELWKSGTTILMITHDPNVAKRTKRTIMIKDGVIVTSLNGNGNGEH